MVTPGQDASIALTFTARDNASPAIQRLGGNLSRLGAAAAGVGPCPFPARLYQVGGATKLQAITPKTPAQRKRFWSQAAAGAFSLSRLLWSMGPFGYTRGRKIIGDFTPVCDNGHSLR